MLDALSIGDLSSAGLLAVVVLLILRGLLVPRRNLTDVMDERDQWREAHRISEEAREVESRQTAALLEQSRLTVALLQSIRDASHDPHAHTSHTSHTHAEDPA